MAIYKTGAAVAALSGKVGGSVFTQSSNSNVVRRTPAQRKTSTPSQLTTRAALTYLNSTWRGLTTQERNAWVAAARVRLYPNRLGVLRQINAFNLYCKVNAQLRSFGLSELTIPPQMVTTAYYPLTTFTYTPGGSPYFTLSWSASAQFFTKATTWQVVSSASHKPQNGYWSKQQPDIIGGTTWVFQTRIFNALGNPIPGQVWWVRFLTRETTKLPSRPYLGSVTIT